MRIRTEGEELHGVILQEGRAASGGRAEVFVPGSVSWPTEGVRILDEHRGPALTKAFPTRDAEGRIKIRARATAAIRAAVAAGKKYMSIEFRCQEERMTKGGVREVMRAFVDAAALVANPEFDTTSAEVRAGAGGRKPEVSTLWL